MRSLLSHLLVLLVGATLGYISHVLVPQAGRAPSANAEFDSRLAQSIPSADHPPLPLNPETTEHTDYHTLAFHGNARAQLPAHKRLALAQSIPSTDHPQLPAHEPTITMRECAVLLRSYQVPPPPSTPPPPVSSTCHTTGTNLTSIAEARATLQPIQRPVYEPYFAAPHSTAPPAHTRELEVYLQHAKELTRRNTGQMSFEQYSYITMLLYRAGQASNALLWGLGNDSSMWNFVNRGGRTTFLENHSHWIAQVQAQIPGIEAYHVKYQHVLPDHLVKLQGWQTIQKAKRMLITQQEVELLVKLPARVADEAWDVILVDSPLLMRMEALWTTRRLLNDTCGGGGASELGPCRTKSGVVHVLIHDTQRFIESTWSDALFGTASSYTAVEGFRAKGGRTQLRHYVFGVPSPAEDTRIRELRAVLNATLLLNTRRA